MTSINSPLGRRRLYTVSALVLLLLLSTTIPVRQTLRVPCMLEPATVWTVRFDGSGLVSAFWQTSLLSESIQYHLYQFGRPDIAEIRLRDDLKDGATVQRGTTIGWVRSRDLAHILQTTEALLNKARATETAMRAPGRPADILVEQQNLVSADVALEAYQPEFERVRKLHEDSLVSAAEFQIAKGNLELLAAQRALAQAKVQAIEAGARREDVDIATAEVARLELEVSRAKDLLGNDEPITAPIQGILSVGGEENVLFSLVRNDTLDAQLIMPEAYGAIVDTGTTVGLRLFAAPEHPLAVTLLRFDYLPADSSALIAHAIVPNPDRRWQRGMSGFAEFETPPLTLFKLLTLRLRGMPGAMQF